MSDGSLPPSPPTEKDTARQDQAGKASTDDGAGDKVSYQTRSVRASVEEHALATWKRHGDQWRPAVVLGGTRYYIQEQRAHARVIREWRASREGNVHSALRRLAREDGSEISSNVVGERRRK